MAAGDTASRTTGAYQVDLGVLYGLLSFSLSGNASQEVDRAAGRYRITMTGEGAGIIHQVEATGVIRSDRFLPVQTKSYQSLRGRETRLLVSFDHDRRVVEYHSRGQTLLLGRLRQVDDSLAMPPGRFIDDLASASLNFAANKLESDGQGNYRTAVVRRAWKENEGPDDVSPAGYRAEIVPVTFRATPDPGTGRLVGLLDLGPLSSWARRGHPARLTFDQGRRLESVESSLILGTTFAVRFSTKA
ncbi:MAG TPA: hypothetical protein VML54_16870 [Candidatus Limnocylindrales bacterium]|nr:hypothetical protein [Candidatus Limnocylindrales bacterium]